MVGKSEEDYLRAIYNVYEQSIDKNMGVRSIDISRILDVTKPSVSAMLRKLIDKHYINMKPYSNIFFTRKGLLEAKRITHNYRVIEVFLTEMIGIESDVIVDEAHRLEHAFSQSTIEKLYVILGNPKKCPHGKVIH
ncbi:metal-dependent transcriptional regulator [Candidatus Woesearchaeota archaeon]|nr:metal-dependent transcriptional regulator [Candidatus Woesearchaeota archaeon]